jgi:hypothetical protein
MVSEIISSMPIKTKIVRIHSSGDFFSKEYFLAWCEVARINPNIIFFGYTKHLDFVIAERPNNFYLQYSFGSHDDSRLSDYPNTPTCHVSEYNNQYPNLNTVCGSKDRSHEDYLAILEQKSFIIDMH